MEKKISLFIFDSGQICEVTIPVAKEWCNCVSIIFSDDYDWLID